MKSFVFFINISHCKTCTYRAPVKNLTHVQPWYRQKLAPSFADALSCLRRELWQERIKCMFGVSAVHDKKLEFLLEALAPAA
jgi:hypothetical protein